MKIIKLKNEQEVALKAAQIICEQVSSNPKSILGLATGTSPIQTYQNLIKMYLDEAITFRKVQTFNLDEYAGLQPSHVQSYRFFMDQQLFNHIDIDKKNTYVPKGINNTNPADYDELISQKGGIDLQLLGLGVNGHIGFNEPGTPFNSLTHEVSLATETIQINADKFFNGDLSKVPKKAFSMGLQSIMNAKKILLLATGESKAKAIEALVNNLITEQWPCTILQKHDNVTVIVDELAGALI